jgi:hypothetical protein
VSPANRGQAFRAARQPAPILHAGIIVNEFLCSDKLPSKPIGGRLGFYSGHEKSINRIQILGYSILKKNAEREGFELLFKSIVKRLFQTVFCTQES